MTDGSGRRRWGAAAWAVHLFTASGVVLALLGIAAVERGDWREALFWMLIALVVDGVDGTLARAVRIGERLPRIDGAALDLIIDYLNYVLIPALLILRAEMLPPAIAFPLAAAILVSSLYVFARRDMKTDDGYFRGFPALWNVVVVYLVLVPVQPWVAAAIVVALVVLTFAPILVVHPFRARDSKRVAPAAAVLWALSTAVLALSERADPWTPVTLAVSLVSLAVLTAVGVVRTVRGPAPGPRPA
jgi:phosphatidylcholine synthase